MVKILLLSAFGWMTLMANEAVIEDVKVKNVNDTYTFSVRILHKDSGWDHYVDRFEVIDAEQNILATRTLWHPHEHEQPFTRGLSGVTLQGKNIIYVRAHDSVDGYSKAFRVQLRERCGLSTKVQ